MKTSCGQFLNLAHYFPYDVKLRLLAHSRSFLANQKARNAIVGAILLRFVILSPGACANPLGLGWDYTLPDSAFSASSEMTPGKEIIVINAFLVKLKSTKSGLPDFLLLSNSISISFCFPPSTLLKMLAAINIDIIYATNFKKPFCK